MIFFYSSLFFIFFFTGACWGSFLNGLAYRLLHQKNILYPRSYCPACHHNILWYDLIPIVSWFLLKKKCRFCHAPISWLYPFIEFIAAIITALLAYVYLTPDGYSLYLGQEISMIPHNVSFFLSYYFFLSLLIISIRTDLEALVIPEIIIFIGIPTGLICSWLNWLPLSIQDAFYGMISGFLFFSAISYLYYRLRNIVGLGFGDIELIMLIGAFTGFYGVWTTILISSLAGTVSTLLYCLVTGNEYNVRIPFGPFLALGATIFVLFRTDILFTFF